MKYVETAWYILRWLQTVNVTKRFGNFEQRLPKSEDIITSSGRQNIREVVLQCAAISILQEHIAGASREEAAVKGHQALSITFSQSKFLERSLLICVIDFCVLGVVSLEDVGVRRAVLDVLSVR